MEQGVSVGCFIVDGYTLFFIVLYFERSEAQATNWLNKKQSVGICLKIM